MSYARFGWDGSDVYIFATRDRDGIDCIECCSCSLRKVDEPYTDMFGHEFSYFFASFFAYTPQDMIDHLNEHAEQGDIVPDETFERIREDYEFEL